MNAAGMLDRCSAFLESLGARPVPKADPEFKITVRGTPGRCPSCPHPRSEHGASGECVHLTGKDAHCWCGW